MRTNPVRRTLAAALSCLPLAAGGCDDDGTAEGVYNIIYGVVQLVIGIIQVAD